MLKKELCLGPHAILALRPEIGVGATEGDTRSFVHRTRTVLRTFLHGPWTSRSVGGYGGTLTTNCTATDKIPVLFNIVLKNECCPGDRTWALPALHAGDRRRGGYGGTKLYEG